jgi:alpha-methylacyl-CoA racemase
LLLEKTGLAGEDLPGQMDRAGWAPTKEKLKAIFKQKTRDEWCEIMEGSDVCFAPVLSMEECKEHPHIKARNTFVEVAGAKQPGPTPRFSRSKAEISCPPPHGGQHTDEALAEWGFAAEELAKLHEVGAIK